MNLMKKLVAQNLKLNKKRTIVMIIGIMLSVALLSALTTLVASYRMSMIVYEKQKNGDFHYAFSGVTKAELKDFEQNRSIESMYEISGLGYARLEGCKNADKPYAYLVATDEKGIVQACFHLLEGRMPQNDEEVVIPRHLKTNGRLEYQVGDTITLQVGKRVTNDSDVDELSQGNPYCDEDEKLVDTKEKTYKIVGIIERPGYAQEDYSAPGYTFVTYTDAQTDNMTVYVRYTKDGLRNQYAVTAGILGLDQKQAALYEKANREDSEMTEEEMNQYYDLISQMPYQVYRNTSLLRFEQIFPLESSLKALLVVAVFVALIIIVTSVYCIKNSFDISITEKIRQYGMLASVGATRKQIRKSVRMEAAMLGAVGLPLGMGCGLLASYILVFVVNALLHESLNFRIGFHVSVIALLAALLLGIVTIYFSAIGSARKAARVTPLEAIRNTNEIKMKSKKLKTPGYVQRLFGIGGVVSYKNMKRNRKKYRTTVISIVICTVTFIVISYFMSMAFRLVELSYGNDKNNITIHDDGENYEDADEIAKNLSMFDNVDAYAVSLSGYLSLDKPVRTSKYQEYYENMGGSEENDTESLLVMCLNREAFAEYAQAAGISDTDGKAILTNSTVLEHYDEEKQKLVSEEAEMFDYKSGDVLHLCNDDQVAVADITLAGTTDVRPTGYTQVYGMAIVVMNTDTWKSLQISRSLASRQMYAFFVSSDPDTLQDDLEKAYPNAYITNRDKDMRSEKSLFVLLAIFAYGLIIVIALIGITNIINTLGTSMELRSREFATLKSVGMTSPQFDRMICLESIFLSGKSLAVGLPLGACLSYVVCLLENRYDVQIRFVLPVMPMIVSAVVVIVLIYLIMKLSLTKISKNNIIETIKNENV